MNTNGRASAKKLLLIEPPFYRLFKDTFSLDRFPLSLGYLAGAARAGTDWDVRAYNADFTPDSEGLSMKNKEAAFARYVSMLADPSGSVWTQVRDAVEAYGPSVVGITAKSQNFRSACIVARIVKEVDPRIVVAVGGPHPTMVKEDVLACGDFDLAAVGEGERTIVELLKVIESGGSLEGIAGLIWRRDGAVVRNLPRAFSGDLDEMAFPHQTARAVLQDYELYPPEAFSFVFATRGCPNNCFFCGSRNIWSRKVRFRSPENVAAEIASLREMGIDHVHFDDDFFGVNRRHVTELCEALIRECPGVKWSCEIHPRLVRDETIGPMKRAGCDSIALGIESGNNEMLRRIRKNITIEEALAAGAVIRGHGIVLQAFFMVGFPDDTEDTIRDTFAAMKKVTPAILAYSIFTPYPGTEAFAYCREKGLIGADYDCSLFNHQSPANFFCANVSRERFRELTGEIERFVVRNNMLFFLRNKSFAYLGAKLRKYGVRKTLRKTAERVLHLVHR